MKTNIYKPTDFFASEWGWVEGFLNNDLYKFMMLDFILAHDEYKDLEVNWRMTIRSKDIKTAIVIPKQSLISQLEATKNISGVNSRKIDIFRKFKKNQMEKNYLEKKL